jgi:hypothetical protein
MKYKYLKQLNKTYIENYYKRKTWKGKMMKNILKEGMVGVAPFPPY